MQRFKDSRLILSTLRSFVFKANSGRFLSIDFGQAFMKITYLESKGQAYEFLDYDLEKIIPTEDNQAEIVGFINGFIQKRAITDKDVYLTVSDPDSIIIRLLTLPELPFDEILEAVKWQLKDDIPFNIESAIIDWQIVKEYTDEEGTKKNEIMCIIADSEIINKYLSIIKACGLIPARISSSFFNYANILHYVPANPAVAAILDMGYKESSISIYKDNKLSFIRHLSFSSGKLTQSLVGTLLSDKGKTELTQEKAEEIKHSFGYPKDESVILKDDIQAIHIISLMRPFLEGIVRELKLSFNYFASNFKEDTPSVLYITGGGANLKNLDWYLNKELNLNVLQLPLPAFINAQAVDKERLSRDLNQIISALGAVLPISTAINLLPQEIKNKKIELIQRVFLRTFGVILGVIFLFSLLIFNLQIHDYRERLKNAQVHLETIQQLKVLKQNIESVESFVDKLEEGKVPVGGLLKELSILVPSNVILNEFILDQTRHVLTLRGEISATGSSVETILTDFMQKIEKSSFFTESSLVTSENRGGVQMFEMKCDLAY